MSAPDGWERVDDARPPMPVYDAAAASGLPFRVRLSAAVSPSLSDPHVVTIAHNPPDRATLSDLEPGAAYARSPRSDRAAAVTALEAFCAQFSPIETYDALVTQQIGPGWEFFVDRIDTLAQPTARVGEYVNDWKVASTQSVEGRAVPVFSAIPWGDADRAIEATITRGSFGWYIQFRVRDLDSLETVGVYADSIRYDTYRSAERTFRAMLGSVTPDQALVDLGVEQRERVGIDLDALFADATGSGGG